LSCFEIGGGRPLSLDAQIRARVGDLDLDAGFAVDTAELVAILGPNGGGKTTLLRALAGLVPLDEGRVVLDGLVLSDVEHNVHVPTKDRSIGFVFQDYLLFPHLSAVDNIAFGLRARGASKIEARSVSMELLDRLGVASMATSKPGALSGGQAQRVALARALAVRPRLLLLDEPLSALDAGARREIRHQLIAQLNGFGGTSLLVTHDPLEALALADRVVVLEHGQVVQRGRPEELRLHPRSDYVAGLVGINLFRGRAEGHRMVLGSGETLLIAQPNRGEVFAVVHPRAVALYRKRPDGTPRNVWSGTVDGIEQLDDRVRVIVGGRIRVVAEVTPGAVSALGLAPGQTVWVSIKATEITVYPA
jgi:molybdate transport system ATP-binding protein